MNADRMRLIADIIEAAPELYDQSELGTLVITSGPLSQPDEVKPDDVLQHTCGTAGCIAGWTAAVFNPVDYGSFRLEVPSRVDYRSFYVTVIGHAVEALDLKDREAELLFDSVWHPEWGGMIGCDVDVDEPWYPTAHQAAAILREFASMGRVPDPYNLED